jgi:hypothetical protein
VAAFLEEAHETFAMLTLPPTLIQSA